MSSSQLERLQHRYGASIDTEIKRWLTLHPLPEGFSAMLHYQFGYDSPSPGGKRFRPILCLFACNACGGSSDPALSVAAGIELVHNFSLVHDDIEDQDPERRHRPSLWKVWGEAQAINAGDALFALAGRAVAATPRASSYADTITLFQDMVLDLTHGQYLDMSFEARPDVTPAEYLEMIGMKSAALIAFSLETGAILGGADSLTATALRTFGLSLGRAFQIHDDILGIWGTSNRTGKQETKDLQNRKKTLPVLMGLEAAHGRPRTVLQHYMAGDPVSIEAVRTALTETGAQALAAEIVHSERRAALRALDTATIPLEADQTLRAVALELTS